MKSRIDKLEYKVAISNAQNRYYYKNNETHRDKDLPSIIWKDGSKFWFKNGMSHRDNGTPSHVYSDGKMYWFENGKFIKELNK